MQGGQIPSILGPRGKKKKKEEEARPHNLSGDIEIVLCIKMEILKRITMK